MAKFRPMVVGLVAVALCVAVHGAGCGAPKMRGPNEYGGLFNLHPTRNGGGYKYYSAVPLHCSVGMRPHCFRLNLPFHFIHYDFR